MSEYKLGLYEKAMPANVSWEEKMVTAKDAGYDWIEISIDETDAKLSRLDWTAQERNDFISLMRKTGLPIRTMCLSGHRKYPFGSSDPEVRRKSLEIMEKAIAFSDDLGIRMIQLAGYDVYYEESTKDSKKYFLENLIKSVDMAAKAGVLLGFETMENEFMNTCEKAMKYVTLVGSPYLGVYPDLGNLTNAAYTYKNDIYEDLELGRGHTFALHLKETVPGKFREIPYGTGHVDFEEGIAKAWDMGIRRFVTEFWYTDSPDWAKDVRDTAALFRGKLDNCQAFFGEEK